MHHLPDIRAWPSVSTTSKGKKAGGWMWSLDSSQVDSFLPSVGSFFLECLPHPVGLNTPAGRWEKMGIGSIGVGAETDLADS